MTLQKVKTYCPSLWNKVFIDYNGDVFTCCLRKPYILGNIYKERLEDIWNNKPIRFFRKRSLSGRLACYYKCTLLKKGGKSAHNSTVAPFGMLRNLGICFGQLCNIRCIMCGLDQKNNETLDFEKLANHLCLRHIKSISVQGGEPLLIHSAKKFFDHAYSQGKKVSFQTNALLINDEWAKKIALNSEYVFISINAASKKTHESINKGSKWGTVLKNIKRIKDARKRYHTEVRINGHMTIVESNLEEIPDFIKNFDKIGFDEIKFGFDSSVPSYLASHPLKMLYLRSKIRNALKGLSLTKKIELPVLKILSLA